MSYIQQLYLQKKKEQEEQAMRNRHQNGVQVRFVANKVIKKYFEEFDEKRDLTLTVNRLNRLVELIDLIYRKEHQWKPLYNDGYIVTSHGLALMHAILGSVYLLEEREEAKSRFERNETEYQIMSESVIDSELNKEIDRLVEKVLYGTRYIDNVDLREMLNSKELQEFRYNASEYQFAIIPNEIINELFADFSFEKFEEFNAQEKLRV